MLESGACSLTIYSCALTDAPTHCHPFVKSCLHIYVLYLKFLNCYLITNFAYLVLYSWVILFAKAICSWFFA